MKDSFSINTRRYAMRKRKWMKAGACALSAVLIMGLYAGPAFAEWIGTGGARAYIINGQAQTGWQQIDGKWYYFNNQSDGTRGKLLKNTTTPDGYYVKEDGSWDENSNK